MNGPHTPAFRRDNMWTRVIERAAAQNAAEGKPAGRMLEQLASTSALIPAARVARMSPEEKRRTDFVPEMEDPRISMMAQARAQALGINNNEIMPQMNDDLPGDIGHVSGDPSDAEIDQMLAAARGLRIHGVESAAEGAAAPGIPVAPSGPAATGRAVILPRGQAAPQMAGLAGPRSMPNFANVEGFDLSRKVAVVDGMEFQLAEDDVVMMKKFAIQVVLDNVTYQLAQALVQLGIPQEMAQATAEKMRETAASAATPGGMSGSNTAGPAAPAIEAVQQVQKGEGPKSVSSGDAGSRRVEESVQDMHSEVQHVGESEASQPQVSNDGEGNSALVVSALAGFGATDDVGDLLGDGGISPP